MLPLFNDLIDNQHNERRVKNNELRMQRRLLRDSNDRFALLDERFIELFQSNKDLVHHLLGVLHLVPEPQRVTRITREIKILWVLFCRLYATRCYQNAIGQDFNLGLSQTIVQRIIHEVIPAIDNILGNESIVFPNTGASRNRIKAEFLQKFNTAGVVGAIDCTHVAMLKPHMEEYNYLNGKGCHSKNVQIICYDHLGILNINGRHAGATDDETIGF